MEKLLLRVYSSEKISASFKIISHASTVIGALSFGAMLLHCYLAEPISALKLFLALLLPFFIVSIVRRVINAPRPYELYSFYDVKPKGKSGQSFPSRHVFSAFAIASLSFSVSVLIGILLIAIGIALAVARVLLGMHFIRDVVAGGIIGIISGIIGIILI
ncbi:MAG: phosphatase PAP2 family protein [Ruminococcaceae bacterium]|nr:phosphatase PAP2 family protein [Oscillospiraceae bacterium]